VFILRAPGIGPARYQRLLAHFKTPEAILSAPRRALEQFALPPAAIEFLQQPDSTPVAADLTWLEAPDNHLISWNDERYPPLLREISPAPPLLYVHGDPSLLAWPQLAIVGTRNPTPSGERTAHDFAADLAAAGLGICSGLAQGIDAAAHRGALVKDGVTLAVMGTGLDRVYPARNRELARKIAGQGGVLISEMPLGTPALAEHFPRRNRIISGLSLGTLVVEAAVQSGSLITARLALEQGREVLAIPGSIHNPQARGCHQLIRQGAKLVETTADVLEEIGPLLQNPRPKVSPASLASASMPASTPVTSKQDDTAPALPPLDEQYQTLLRQIGADPVAVDTLVARCGLTADVVSSMLLILELHGYVAAKPGGFYFRVATEDE